MKVGGKTLPLRVSRTLVLKRGDGEISLTIHAVPLGFDEKVLARIPLPDPKRRYAMQDGKAIRDSTGRHVVEEVRDSGFRERERHLITLQGVALIYESLRGDPQITWEALEPQETAGAEEWRGFYEAIYEELKQGHFSSGDLGYLLGEIREMNSQRGKHLAEAREGLLSEASLAEEPMPLTLPPPEDGTSDTQS